MPEGRPVLREGGAAEPTRSVAHAPPLIAAGKRATRRTLWILALLVWLSPPAPAADPTPSAQQVLASAGFDAGVLPRVLAGEMVERSLESTSERDLAAALAFLVPQPPEAFLDELVRDQLIAREDPNTISTGTFEGDGSLEALAGLSLSADEKQRYARAEPGDDLNLSSAEVAALKALGGDESGVEAALKQILLARYRAYRQQGLVGVAAYDRGGKTTDAAGDLRRASEASHALEHFDPGFYRYLQSLPKDPPSDLREVFHWSHYRAHGEPTLILTHSFTAKVGAAIAAVQRQYYVSRGYNVEQAAAGFIPVQEGTLVVYANHTSTDQVAGFGGGAKRSLGEKVMGAQLKALYEKVRGAAEKP